MLLRQNYFSKNISVADDITKSSLVSQIMLAGNKFNQYRKMGLTGHIEICTLIIDIILIEVSFDCSNQ